MREHPKFGAICFDCDSTLTRIEGIDELARRRAAAAEITRLTAAAMDGIDRPLPGRPRVLELGARDRDP